MLDMTCWNLLDMTPVGQQVSRFGTLPRSWAERGGGIALLGWEETVL